MGTVPALGVCTLCNRQFKVPVTDMKRVADAQKSLRLQFAEHKCKSETESETEFETVSATDVKRLAFEGPVENDLLRE